VSDEVEKEACAFGESKLTSEPFADSKLMENCPDGE
jgi:hypothetical protein